MDTIYQVCILEVNQTLLNGINIKNGVTNG